MNALAKAFFARDFLAGGFFLEVRLGATLFDGTALCDFSSARPIMQDKSKLIARKKQADNPLESKEASYRSRRTS
jgi:hypothetical protein